MLSHFVIETIRHDAEKINLVVNNSLLQGLSEVKRGIMRLL